MSVKIIEPGMLTTVQDLGRFGYRHLGIMANGVMDAKAANIANLMLGNDVNAAVLEFTLLGPELEFTKSSVICITGAKTKATLDGQELEQGRVIQVRAGQRLKTGNAYQGCRGYLAIKGGFSVKEVLHSKSTYLRGGIGGFDGRALKSGDELRFTEFHSSIGAVKELAPSFEFMDYLGSLNQVRFIYGKQADWFTSESLKRFCQQSFTVSSASDRMGYRLEGQPVKMIRPQELLTEGVTMGTIQIPANGQPIVLMSDSQPTGGYPKIGEVISVDLPRLAQLKPGDSVSFQPVSLAEAQSALIKETQFLNRLSIAAQHCWSRNSHD